ncbi:MAG: ATP-binding protein [Myxococcaceae bacterium]
MAARIAWLGRDDPEGAAALVIDSAPSPSAVHEALARAALARQQVIVLLDGQPAPYTLRQWQDACVWVVLRAGLSPEALQRTIEQVIAQHQPTSRQRLCSALEQTELLALRFQTLDQAEDVAEAVACVLPPMRLRKAAVLELLVNAVEHGNLDLSGAQKQELLKTGRWAHELQRRLTSLPWSRRWARARVERTASEWSLEIIDEGSGFEWPPAADPLHPPRLHGRGIALARGAFDELVWLGTGNHVIARVWR